MVMNFPDINRDGSALEDAQDEIVDGPSNIFHGEQVDNNLKNQPNDVPAKLAELVACPDAIGSLSVFPDELFSHITKHLAPADVISFAVTCSKAYSLSSGKQCHGQTPLRLLSRHLSPEEKAEVSTRLIGDRLKSGQRNRRHPKTRRKQRDEKKITHRVCTKCGQRLPRARFAAAKWQQRVIGLRLCVACGLDEGKYGKNIVKLSNGKSGFTCICCRQFQPEAKLMHTAQVQKAIDKSKIGNGKVPFQTSTCTKPFTICTVCANKNHP